ncbi:hypothetical protein [Pseudomonas farris]
MPLSVSCANPFSTIQSIEADSKMNTFSNMKIGTKVGLEYALALLPMLTLACATARAMSQHPAGLMRLQE